MKWSTVYWSIVNFNIVKLGLAKFGKPISFAIRPQRLAVMVDTTGSHRNRLDTPLEPFRSCHLAQCIRLITRNLA